MYDIPRKGNFETVEIEFRLVNAHLAPFLKSPQLPNEAKLLLKSCSSYFYKLP
jgi:hypothetical protein